MDAIRSILVALDRDCECRPVITRALSLARLLHARLELFVCDAEHAYVQRHQYDARAAALAPDQGISEALRDLHELWRSLGAADVEVSFDAVWESPQYEGIVRRVRRSRIDLVIRGIGAAAAGGTLAANDWELVRTCPVPLLLTRGKRWPAQPAVAAAIDISGEESAGLTRAVLSAGQRMACACGGSLEILYATQLDEPAGETLAANRRALAQRAREAQVEARELHVVRGEPASALPAFAARQHYDLIALGALTHRKALTALVGTLTGRLIDSLDCDFLLVKSPSYRSPVP
ncbi:MAG TPA: universal stress protein [Steroidobacteraceae bacterium]|nr:universal stress protein [Steroidobacteraceae bacterium]